MKRRRVIVGLVVLAVGCLAAAALMLFTPSRLEERVQRVRPGMTLAEVEAVLGAPPGDHTRYRGYARQGGKKLIDVLSWDWDDGAVVVRFGADHRVEDVSFYPNTEPPTIWDRMRHHLQW